MVLSGDLPGDIETQTEPGAILVFPEPFEKPWKNVFRDAASVVMDPDRCLVSRLLTAYMNCLSDGRIFDGVV